jgi:hypothetical protein
MWYKGEVTMGVLVHAVKKSGRNVCDDGLQGHNLGQCFGDSVKISSCQLEHKHIKVTCKACIAKSKKKVK